MCDNFIRPNDDLDALLDSALAIYSNPEPSSRLEVRILASTTRADNHTRSLRWLTWAVPALAALLLVTILLSHHMTAPDMTLPIAADLLNPRLPVSHSPGTSPLAKATPPRSTPPRTTRTLRTVARKNPPLPRLEVFPTPMPLSREEQALAALVNRDSRNSKELAQQITQPAPQGQPIEPLRIAAIHIPPLNPPDNGGNN